MTPRMPATISSVPIWRTSPRISVGGQAWWSSWGDRPPRGERASHRPGDLDRAARLEHGDAHVRRERRGVCRELARRIAGRGGGRCAGRCPSGSAPRARAAAARAPSPPRARPCGPGRSSAPSRRPAAARRRASPRGSPSPRTARCRPRSRRRPTTKPTPLDGGRPGSPPVVDRRRPPAPHAGQLDVLAGAQRVDRRARPTQRTGRAARRHHRRRPGRAGAATPCRGGRGARARAGSRRGARGRPARATSRRRCATRGRSRGSVIRRAPPSSSTTVACPSQVSDRPCPPISRSTTIERRPRKAIGMSTIVPQHPAGASPDRGWAAPGRSIRT